MPEEGSTHRLICSFPAQHSKAKAGLLVPFNKHVQFLGVCSCRYEKTVLRFLRHPHFTSPYLDITPDCHSTIMLHHAFINCNVYHLLLYHTNLLQSPPSERQHQEIPLTVYFSRNTRTPAQSLSNQLITWQQHKTYTRVKDGDKYVSFLRFLF